MLKRAFAVFSAVCILLSMGGCKSILEGETSVIIPYEGLQNDTSPSDDAVKLSTYNEFKAAVTNMVRNYEDSASFRITDFDRSDIESALPAACQDVALNDPLGSYAVYYISCTVTEIVAYYDVQVSIVYKRTEEELGSLKTVYSDRYLQYALLSAMENYDESCTFYTSIDSITADHITVTLLEQYYRSPLNVVVLPSVEINSYPSSEGERIIEVLFSYDFARSVLISMTSRTNSAAQKMVEQVGGANDRELLLALCEKLFYSCSYAPDSISGLSDTAYGALVNSSATSEGYAMAFKALCDKLGIECIVVNGKFMGQEHFWNIVTLSGVSSHVDVTQYAQQSTNSLKSDDEMRSDYWWDTSAVPSCSGGMSQLPPDAAPSDTAGVDAASLG